MKRLLIDLTDLELWNGNHGGTQRVVYGIANNFFLNAEALDYEVQFISFSDVDKTFHKTSFAPIYERTESQKTSAEPSNGPVISRKARLKYRLRPYVPEAVRKSPAARKAAIKSLSVALKASRQAKSLAVQMKSKSAIKSGENITFAADDVVLVLGKPWDNLDIQATLTREKARLKFKLVELVYDMIIPLHPELHHPDLFAPYTQHMFEAVAASDLLLSISKSTAKDVKTFCAKLNLTCPPITTIRLGDEVDVVSGIVAKPDDRINKQFVACVGTIEIRKNHTLLYYAYKLAAQRGINLPQLVIVGSRGWLTGDFQYLVSHDSDVKDKIIILDNVTDSGLAWIYANCAFTVYPSFYEGWGLPVAEALNYDTFCIASNSSSIPEIAGDLIDYFSPYNVEELLQKIVTYQDKTELDKKTAMLAEKYKTTTWQETFESILPLLKNL
jgi:glycosyltransferase involved in cell wall biosynthesis